MSSKQNTDNKSSKPKPSTTPVRKPKTFDESIKWAQTHYGNKNKIPEKDMTSIIIYISFIVIFGVLLIWVISSDSSGDAKITEDSTEGKSYDHNEGINDIEDENTDVDANKRVNVEVDDSSSAMKSNKVSRKSKHDTRSKHNSTRRKSKSSHKSEHKDNTSDIKLEHANKSANTSKTDREIRRHKRIIETPIVTENVKHDIVTDVINNVSYETDGDSGYFSYYTDSYVESVPV